MKATNLLRVAGYCRTSSEGQRDNTSIASQKADILRYAASRGWTVVRWYVDECKSGAKIEGRDEFQRMMREAASGDFDVVVVYDLSRFGRDGADIIESSRTLQRDHGVELVDTCGMFDSSDDNRIVSNYVGAGMAEAMRRQILKNTHKGRIGRAREGKPWSAHRPIGRDYDRATGRWDVTEKGRAIAEALRRYVQGESLTDLCSELGLGDRKRISEWVANGQLAGTYVASFESLGHRESVPIPAIPPVVEPELLAQVRARLSHNRTFNRTDATDKYVLSGFIRCECCGKALTGQTLHGRVYYRHRATSDCSLTSVRGDAVEPGVLDYLYRRFLDAPAFDAAVAKAMPTADDRKAKQAERKRAADRLAKVDREIANLVNAIVQGADPSMLIGKQDELKAERAHLSARLATIDDEVAAMPSAERLQAAATLTRLRLMSRYWSDRDWRSLPIAEIKPFLLHLFGETNPTTKTGVSVGLDEAGRIVGTFRGNVEFDADFCDGRILSKRLQREIDVARMILRSGYDREVAAANARRAEALAAAGGDDSDPDYALRPFRDGKQSGPPRGAEFPHEPALRRQANALPRIAELGFRAKQFRR